MTVGDVGDLSVGKNAIYYDNAGVEWDAVITKIIDNPISIAQACCPMWKAGWLMVVIVGEVMREVSTLSKPMTESSSGTLIPKLWAALMAAAAKTSEQVKNASGRSLEESSCKIEEYAKV